MGLRGIFRALFSLEESDNPKFAILVDYARILKTKIINIFCF